MTVWSGIPIICNFGPDISLVPLRVKGEEKWWNAFSSPPPRIPFSWHVFLVGLRKWAQLAQSVEHETLNVRIVGLRKWKGASQSSHSSQ